MEDVEHVNIKQEYLIACDSSEDENTRKRNKRSCKNTNKSDTKIAHKSYTSNLGILKIDIGNCSYNNTRKWKNKFFWNCDEIVKKCPAKIITFYDLQNETHQLHENINAHNHLTEFTELASNHPNDNKSSTLSPPNIIQSHFITIKPEIVTDVFLSESENEYPQDSYKSESSENSIATDNEIITNLDDECEIITNKCGTMKLILDGYTHKKNSIKKPNYYWKCSEKNKKCCGSAVTIKINNKHYLKKVNREHNHETPNQNTKGFAEAYKQLQSSVITDFSECKFVLNRFGNPKLVIDGYYYSKHKSKNNSYYWKCEKKKTCGGYAVTIKDHNGKHSLKNPVRSHNHPIKSNFSNNRIVCKNPDIFKLRETINENQILSNIIKSNDKLDFNVDLEKSINLTKKSNSFGEKCKVINFIQGSDRMIIKNYQYIEITNYKNIYYWQCSYNKSCTSQAETELINDNHILCNLTEHNHFVNIQNDHTPTSRFETIDDFVEKCELTITKRGFPKLILNGFYYNKRRDQDDLFNWKCEKRGECNGAILTFFKNNQHYFVKTNREHNHPNNEIMKKDLITKKKLKYKPREYTLCAKTGKFNKAGKRTDFIKIEQMENTNENLDESNEYYNIISNYKNCNSFNDPTEDELKNGSILCEFILSSHGNPRLCFNGYMYNRNKGKVNNHYWYCDLSKSKKCLGYARTVLRNEKHYLINLREHNHAGNIERQVVCQLLAKIREKCINQPELTSKYLVNQELVKLPPSICGLLPGRHLILGMINRKRKLHKQMQNSNINDKFLTSTKIKDEHEMKMIKKTDKLENDNDYNFNILDTENIQEIKDPLIS